MDKLIERINELAHKHKTVGLSDQELAERADLRKKYLDRFRKAFRQQLDNIEIVDEPPSQGLTH
ncbi:DUF896 domain-containing protein [Cohnella sp. AR92]|uniref:DUF896 domain-containing protein n=1 Tax=Cohnella sp. AR92 TaxID=648716 RepID=UPI000F8C5578|nr:DUF896 domain-containing protein [Cohnella sp. AR92]RUS46818.1 DUF896 domain-containing protein [Cohnella sp. AR92]